MEWNDPHWLIPVAIGVLLAEAIPYIKGFIILIKNRKEDAKLKGDWYGYHWTYKEHKPLFVRSKWSLRGDIKRRIVASIDLIDEGLKYTGTSFVERNNFVVSLESAHGQKHSEREHPVFRFKDPLPEQHIIKGFFLSYDHDSNIASGSAVLSKKPLTNAEAIAKMKEFSKVETDKPLMKIP